MINAGSGGRTGEMEVGGGDCASVAEKLEACSVPECEKVPGLENVGAVDGDDWVALAKNALGVTEGQARKTGVKERLQKGRLG